MLNKAGGVVLFLVIVASFIIYAPINYKFLNSDQGIHALMAANFQLKNSIYYWGQNRLGSILPLLASFLVKIKINPLLAVSIVQYGFLTGIIFLFNTLLDKFLLKIIFAIFLVFPLASFVEMINIGQPYVPQIFFFVLLVILAKKITNDYAKKNVVVILLFWLISVLSIWLSELSYISVAIITGFVFIYISKNKTNVFHKIKVIVKTPFFYSTLFGSTLILMIQKILKHKFKDPIFEKYGVNNLHEVINAFKIQGVRYFHGITFTDKEIYTNTFTLLFTLLIVIMVGRKIYKIKCFNCSFLYKNSTVFFMVSMATFCAINFSEWAGIEQFPYRYYAFSYFCLFAGVILLLQDYFSWEKGKIIVWIMLATSLIGGASYLNLNKDQGRFKINKDARKFLSSLKQTTFIGNYWYTYIMASYNANNITAIACEKSQLRNPQQLNKAVENKNIYLIKNNWLKYFPDTIKQYSRTFIKSNNNDIAVGNAIIHRYVNYNAIHYNQRLDKLIKTINNDENWMKLIREKARKQKINVNEMIKKDANYILKKAEKIKNQVAIIKQDSNWMKLIQEKAKKNNLSVNEMLKKDAKYIVNSTP